LVSEHRPVRCAVATDILNVLEDAIGILGGHAKDLEHVAESMLRASDPSPPVSWQTQAEGIVAFAREYEAAVARWQAAAAVTVEMAAATGMPEDRLGYLRFLVDQLRREASILRQRFEVAPEWRAHLHPGRHRGE